MATKTKLELAVERHASKLNDAQRELVRAQLATYKRNRARLAQLESELAALDSRQAVDREGVRIKQAQRAVVANEHSQLAQANSRIAVDINELLKE